MSWPERPGKKHLWKKGGRIGDAFECSARSRSAREKLDGKPGHCRHRDYAEAALAAPDVNIPIDANRERHRCILGKDIHDTLKAILDLGPTCPTTPSAVLSGARKRRHIAWPFINHRQEAVRVFERIDTVEDPVVKGLFPQIIPGMFNGSSISRRTSGSLFSRLPERPHRLDAVACRVPACGSHDGVAGCRPKRAQPCAPAARPAPA
jgi:hypothetical protein